MTAQIKILKNTSDVRIAYKNNRAIATIIKQPDGKYRVVKMYEGYVKDCDSYNEARTEALTAAPLRQTSNVRQLRTAS